jgi:hypothetical protein
MHFRGVVLVVLWTMLIGPVMDSPGARERLASGQSGASTADTFKKRAMVQPQAIVMRPATSALR